MTKLTVRLTNFRRFATLVDQDGIYTIQNVPEPEDTQYGRAIMIEVVDESNEQKTLPVSYWIETSSKTNLGRLVEAFGCDTDAWIGRKLRVSINEDGKRRVEPLSK